MCGPSVRSYIVFVTGSHSLKNQAGSTVVKKGGDGKLGKGKKPSLSHNLPRGAAMTFAELSAKAFEALPVEQRNFWRDAAREAAATTGDEEESGDEEDEFD